ncbi:hypothetical protein MYCTH_2125321 [Thermothelomyces thermophilus ATCC 42464]|uniref:Uncharacterized protein n=1 Tax=Thermothelomyces thermophilus (strain ATCC 42464 / BCRC 31852 / DSM 1799) TaxID=573729 RepID=G2Q964_THET4|nr:uncharacterized protein MYCTH_2125321 [Thermothelomyces thermophilus ATCC 42464]AEO56356.1 hypothetical protein MYCTH_2125321 [Thermothelomyces thermophilus ATCC 42464]
MPYKEESRLLRQRPASFVSPRTLAYIDTGAAFEANGWVPVRYHPKPTALFELLQSASCLLPLPALAVGWKAVGSPVGSNLGKAHRSRLRINRPAQRNSHTGLDPPRQGTSYWSHGGVYCVKERGQEQPPLAELGKRRFTGAYERRLMDLQPVRPGGDWARGPSTLDKLRYVTEVLRAMGDQRQTMACKPIPAW